MKWQVERFFNWTGLLTIMIALGCSAVKERQRIVIPPAYVRAQTANLDELIAIVNQRYAAVKSFTVPHFEVEFTGGSIEEGYLEKYRKAKGYLVAEKPKSIFVNILNPLTNSSVLVMASRQDRFQIWVPSKNQFVTGSTTVKSSEENPVYNVRPYHIVQGILVEPISDQDPRNRYYVEEREDGRFKYYVLVLLQLDEGSPVVQLLRKIWIERSSMSIWKQEYYEDSQLVSTITYGVPVEVNGRLVSSRVEVNRPLDHYSIRFDFDTETVALDKILKAEAFQIKPPAGAEVIEAEAGVTR